MLFRKSTSTGDVIAYSKAFYKIDRGDYIALF